MKFLQSILPLFFLFCVSEAFSQVSFTSDAAGSCAPTTINFTNTGITGDHQEWYFGDGNFVTDVVNPSHFYSNAGGYWVTLYIYDVNWNSLGFYQEYITLEGAPSYISMSNGIDTHCPNENITFQFNSNGSEVSWTFGDGTNELGYSYTEHSYTTPGMYVISATYEDPNCGPLNVQDTLYIISNPTYFATTNPYPGFQVNPNQTCPGDPIYGYPYGSYASTSWDFGDGNTFNDVNADWSYSNYGDYQVSVTLTNGCGLDTTLIDSVFIDATTPVLNPTLYSLPDTVCPGENFDFYGYADGGYGQTIQVDMGDLNTVNGETGDWLEHSYASIGTYYISATIFNGCGNSATVLDSVVVDLSNQVANPYSYLPDTICPGEEFNVYANADGADSVYYDMGDGSAVIGTDAGYSIDHTYSSNGTYYVNMTIVNICGNSTTINDSIVVSNSAPVNNPYLSINNSNVCPGDQIQYSTNYEYDVYVDFGDGSGSTQDYGYHSYNNPGTYIITATIQNQCGSSVVLTETINVSTSIPINSNDVWVYANPEIVCPTGNVNLEVSSGFASYVWDFGDGTTGIGQEINHIYNSVGVYDVEVLVTNGCGFNTIGTTTVEVQDDLPVYGGVQLYNPIDTICLGNTLFLQVDQYTGVTYEWDMGDGTILNGFGITHDYADYGTYNVSITGSNACGNDSTIYQTIVVSDDYTMQPGEVFAYVQTQGCIGDENMFVLIPSGAGEVSWDFGDGTTSSNVESVFVQGVANVDVTSHIYSDTGTYTATFTIVNACGNSFTDSVQVIVGNTNSNIQYQNSIIFDQTETVCQGTPFEFMAIGGGTYIWDFGDGSGQLVTQTSLSPVEHIYEDAGYYTVTLTGVSGCGTIDVVDAGIFVPESKIEVITNTVVEATCSQNNGIAVVTADGGAPPYSFQWTNGDQGVIADSLNSGVYVVTVTDLNDCSNEGIATVSDQEGVVILVDNVVDVDCYGQANGSVSVSILGGQPPYEISWSNGDVTEDIYGLVAGPYEIFVTDANGCFSVESIEVTQPAKTNISVITSNAICGGTSGIVSATVNNGTAPFNYIWPNASGPSNQTSGLNPGIHTLLIIDGNTCLLQKDFVVNENGSPIIITDSINTGTCDGDLSDIYISTIGGQGPFTFEWSNGTTNQNLIDVLPSEYSVSVSSTNGCTSYQFFTVQESVPDQVEICMVDVDTITNSNLVIWTPLNDPTIDYYNIYKESSEAGLYYFVGSTSADSLSEYYDYDSDPAIRSWRYKIAAVDNCGNEGELSDEHKTMHLTSNFGLNGAINLIWDSYNGFNYNTYYINRYHPTTDWQVIDSVASNAFTYSDLNPPGDSNLVYLISIPSPNNCLPQKAQDYNSSRSNKRGINVSEEEEEEEPVGLTENASTFSIYPNPTNAIVKIHYSEVIETIAISDLTGKILFDHNVNATTYESDLTKYADGVYFIKISTASQELVGKIIKE